MSELVFLDDSEILIVEDDAGAQLLDTQSPSVVTIDGEPDQQVLESETDRLLVLEDADGGQVIDYEGDTFLLAEGELGPRGVQGEPGLAGSAGLEFPFAWGDASPRTVVLAAAGKLVYGVQITISQAFDGVAPALQVGDALVLDRLMRADQNDPATQGSYSTGPAHVYGSATEVLLTITPGDGASAGSGLLTILIEQ